MNSPSVLARVARVSHYPYLRGSMPSTDKGYQRLVWEAWRYVGPCLVRAFDVDVYDRRNENGQEGEGRGAPGRIVSFRYSVVAEKVLDLMDVVQMTNNYIYV